MTLKRLANRHNIDILKPLITSGSSLGVNKSYVLEKRLTCGVDPKDILEVFDVGQRSMLIPHKIYFDEDPEILQDRRIIWRGVGNNTLMRITAVPYNVSGRGRLWVLRANSRSTDNIGVNMQLVIPQGDIPKNHVKVWEEKGEDLYEVWLSPEEYKDLLNRVENRGLRQTVFNRPSNRLDDPSRFVSKPKVYVTLNQIAAIVQRSKRTLEKYASRKVDQLPDPDIQGSGGKSNEWDWVKIRPWLEKEFGKKLPEVFPGTEILPTETGTHVPDLTHTHVE